MSRALVFSAALALGATLPAQGEAELAGQLAYSRLSGGYWQIFVYDLGSGSHRPLTKSPSDKRDPVWTPAGDVAFRTHNDELFTVSTARGEEVPLRSDIWPVADAAWSAQGELIVARLRTDLSDASSLWRVVPESENVEVLTRGPGLSYQADFFGDGRRLVYVRSRGAEGSALRVVDGDTGRDRVIFETEGHVAHPAADPLAEAVAYASDATGDYELWWRTLSGDAVRRLTESPGLDTSPAFSPDGRWIAFATFRRGRFEIWVLPRAGGEARPLFEIESEARELAWR